MLYGESKGSARDLAAAQQLYKIWPWYKVSKYSTTEQETVFCFTVSTVTYAVKAEDTADRPGTTPLRDASLLGQTFHIYHLLKAGANMYDTDEDGNTPAHVLSKSPTTWNYIHVRLLLHRSYFSAPDARVSPTEIISMSM